MWMLTLSFWLALATSWLVRQARSHTCERLKRSLTYTQEEAPRDLSGVLPVVVARVNQVLEGVVNVEVGYHGDDLQGKVGEHLVKCEVTRLASVLPDDMKEQAFVDDIGRQVVSQCFEVPFTILDTNECTLPLHHPLRHQCRAPAICINTNGSYDCVCPRMADKDAAEPTTATENSANPRSSSKYPPAGATVDEQFWVDLQAQERGPWEVAYNSSSRSTCVSMASTHGCCPVRANTKDAMLCRSGFHCPISPCASHKDNDCADTAKCVRKHNPNIPKNYECQCPQGFMGNGHKCRPGIDLKPEPKVRFDGVTPTEETIKHNFYCDCTIPVVDACSGFPPCTGKHEICVITASNVPQCGCKPGYVMHDIYGCVDESPPLMKLRNDPNGDHTLRLKQGDFYKEEAVDIEDDNAEEYLRSLKIAYSIPMPYGCLTKVGEFHVNYTIATPWTSPSFVRLTRRVVIEDIDECSIDATKFQTQCPSLIPKCDKESGAKCVNKIGSYTCQCPDFTSGDGFLPGLSFDAPGAVVPIGFNGGTGCRDTSKPVIELVGPNPKAFRIAQCGGLSGVMNMKQDDHDADLRAAQQKYYGDDIKTMIRLTAGAELCATHEFSRPNASDCVKAFDETYKGRVDLSKSVAVGDPVQKSMLQWRVPYNVVDEAGNKADTVWRDVIVQEVDFADIEVKALADERKKAVNRKTVSTVADCPKCPACDCKDKKAYDVSMCNSICEARQENTCPQPTVASNEKLSNAVMVVIWLESFLPASVVAAVVAMSALYAAYLVLNAFWRLYFSAPRYTPVYNAAEREEGLRNHITVYSPQLQQQNDARSSTEPTSNGGLRYGPSGFAQMNSTPQGPPTASASIYGPTNPQLFAPTPRSWATSSPSGFQSTPSSQNGFAEQQRPPIDIYERSRNTIITPSKRGEGTRQRSPYRS
ncbi:hypothetical protein ACA910_022317 [Epithemia clementina (nom. ined.)]